MAGKTRTFDRLQRDLHRIIKAQRPAELTANLRPLPEGVTQAEQTGTGTARAAGEGGDSIASPLDEGTADDRTVWGVADIASTDGIVIFEYTPLKQITVTDANLNDVVFNLDDPENPA